MALAAVRAAGKEHGAMKQGITVQERLKDLRTERNLKLEELAAVTKISKSALGSYENDDYKEISHKNLVALADFMECQPITSSAGQRTGTIRTRNLQSCISVMIWWRC